MPCHAIAIAMPVPCLAAAAVPLFPRVARPAREDPRQAVGRGKCRHDDCRCPFALPGALFAIIGTLTAIIGTLTAIIGTPLAIIGTLTAIIGTPLAIIGTPLAIIGTLLAIIGTLFAMRFGTRVPLSGTGL